METELEEKKDKKDKFIATRADQKTIKRLDFYVKKMNMKSRAHLIDNLIKTGLDDLDLMNSTGLLTMAVKGYDVLGSIKKSLVAKKFVFESERLIIDLDL